MFQPSCYCRQFPPKSSQTLKFRKTGVNGGRSPYELWARWYFHEGRSRHGRRSSPEGCRSMNGRQAWYHLVLEESPGSPLLCWEAKRSFLWAHRPNEHSRKQKVTHSSLLVSYLRSNASCATAENRCRRCTATSGCEWLSQNDVGGGEKDDKVYAEHSVSGIWIDMKVPGVKLLSGGIYITRPSEHKHWTGSANVFMANKPEKCWNKLATMLHALSVEHSKMVCSLQWLSWFAEQKHTLLLSIQNTFYLLQKW